MKEEGVKKLNILFNTSKFRKIYLLKALKKFIVIPLTGLIMIAIIVKIFNCINGFTLLLLTVFFVWLLSSPLVIPLYYFMNKSNFLKYSFRTDGDRLIIDGLYENGGRSSHNRYYYYSIKNISSIVNCNETVKIYGDISQLFYVKNTSSKDKNTTGFVVIDDVFDGLDLISGLSTNI